MKKGLPVSDLGVGDLYLPVIGDNQPRSLVVLEKVSADSCREFNDPKSKLQRILDGEHMFQVVPYLFGELHEEFIFIPVEEGKGARVNLGNLFRKQNGRGLKLDPDSRNELVGFAADQPVICFGIAGITIKMNGGGYPMLTIEH